MIEPFKKSFQFKSVRGYLTFWFIIVVLVLMISAPLMYSYMMKTQKTSIFGKLEAVREHQVAEVNNWLVERIGDIRIISRDNEVRMLENIHEGKEEDIERNIILVNAVRDILNRYSSYYDTFYEIFIISPHSKKILVSTDKIDEGISRSEDPYFIEALEHKELFIKDIYYSATEGKPSMAFSTPIYGLNKSNEIIGILVARVDLDKSLYKLLMNRAGMGETGEMLIVNKDLYALSELRWYRDAPLKLKIDAEASVNASSGMTGIVETEDYRGEPVLAAYTHIPGTGWGFVAKQDIKEIYAPIRELRKWALLVAVMTLFGVTVIAFRISRYISGPIEALHEGSEIIGSGNLDYKIGTDRKDEIGRLSRTFDRMTKNLKIVTASRDDLNKEIAERKSISEALRNSEEMYRITLSNISDTVFITDDIGLFKHVCPNVSINFGYTAEEAYEIGNISKLLGENFIIPKKVKALGEVKNIEVDIEDKYKQRHSLLVNVKSVSIRNGTMLFTCRDITERKRLEKEILEIEEKERRSIGRDMHDGLGQLLTGISIKLKCLESDLKEKMIPEAEDAEKIMQFVDEAKKQTKCLSKGLLPLAGKEGYSLIEVIKQMVVDTEEIFDIPCLLRCDKTVVIQNETVITHLYRIAQEAVTNAVKHAESESIKISLYKEDNRITMTIRDDGRGIAEVPENNKGMGLNIMNYRAGMIRASLDVSPDINGGTVVTCIYTDKKGSDYGDHEKDKEIIGCRAGEEKLWT